MTKQLYKELRLFDPNGRLISIWKILSIFAVLYSVFEVPVRLAFTTPTVEPLETLIIVIFFGDILVNFNTPFEDPDTHKFSIDRLAIASNYMKFWFWFDLVASIPFDEIANVSNRQQNDNSAVQAIKFLRLARMLKAIKTSEIIKKVLERFIDPLISNVFVLSLQIIFVSHIVGCFWYFITISDDSDTIGHTSWVIEFGFEDSDTSTKYVASLYFAVMSLLTIGLGDIHPTNSGERIYALLTMLIGSMLFGAIISKVREIVESRNLLSKDHRQQIEEFKSYLGTANIENILKIKAQVCFICIYFKYL